MMERQVVLELRARLEAEQKHIKSVNFKMMLTLAGNGGVATTLERVPAMGTWGLICPQPCLSPSPTGWVFCLIPYPAKVLRTSQDTIYIASRLAGRLYLLHPG